MLSPIILNRDQHCISRKHISPGCLRVLYTLNDAGYKAFIVGGAVRDLLLGIQPKDFDVATDATPEQVAERRAALVPRAVTMRQARLALHAAGQLAAVEAAINALSEPARTAARIEWDYSGEVQRHHGLVAALAPALGLSDEQVDALFIGAGAL